MPVDVAIILGVWAYAPSSVWSKHILDDREMGILLMALVVTIVTLIA